MEGHCSRPPGGRLPHRALAVRGGGGPARRASGAGPLKLSQIVYVPISLRKSAPLQNRQLIIYFYLLKYEVDSFVEELAFSK